MNTEKQFSSNDLAQKIYDARVEISALTVARYQARTGTAFQSASRKLRERIGEHRARVRETYDTLVRSTIERRLAQVSDCEFQMMVNGVPFYAFADHGTGTRISGIAYGTEANRIRYQLKADLEKSMRRAALRELGWVEDTLDTWDRMLARAPMAARGLVEEARELTACRLPAAQAG